MIFYLPFCLTLYIGVICFMISNDELMRVRVSGQTYVSRARGKYQTIGLFFLFFDFSSANVRNTVIKKRMNEKKKEKGRGVIKYRRSGKLYIFYNII